MNINFGKLTPDETRALLVEAIRFMSDEQLFAALNEALTTEQKEELGESWFNLDKGGV